jgi:hypothetical protein
MLSRRTRKYSGAIPFDIGGRQAGQAMLEYILILLLVVTMFMLVARPFLGDFAKKIQEAGRKGIFTDDPSGSNFYYFPIPKG